MPAPARRAGSRRTVVAARRCADLHQDLIPTGAGPHDGFAHHRSRAAVERRRAQRRALPRSRARHHRQDDDAGIRHKGTTDNTLTGVTRNPWNLDRTSGGSSGAVPRPSLRVSGHCRSAPTAPAACASRRRSAVASGSKPSFGRGTSVAAVTVRYRCASWATHPHGHRCGDADERGFPDPTYETGRRCHSIRVTTVGLNDGIRGLRVAYSPTLGYVNNVHPAVAAAVRRTADGLAELGAHVEEVDPASTTRSKSP